MEIYSIVLIALTVLSLFEVFEQRHNSNGIIFKVGQQSLIFNGKKLVVLLIVLTFMLISALRDTSVGRDLINYIPRYSHLGQAEWGSLFPLARSYSFEYGFAIFCKVLYLIDQDPAFFLVITSIIVSIGFYNISKLSKMPLVTMFILFGFGIFGSSMNIVRQFLSFTILTFSISCITERKLWKFLAIVIVASTFHTMALLFIPLYFLYTIKYNRTSLIAVVFVSVLMALFGSSLLGAVIGRTTFGWYLTRIGSGSGESTLVFLGAILFAVYVYRNKIMDIDEQDNLCIWGLSIAIICNVLALRLGIFARLMTFFTPFIAVLIPDLVYAMKRKDEINRYIYVVVGLMVIAFFIFYYQFVLMGGEAEGARWFPYVRRP